MKIYFLRTGFCNHHYARTLGIGLVAGNLSIPDSDESRAIVYLGIGFWWFLVRIEFWRQP